ncbi:PARP-domain-containing protein [Lentinus brumalis]|uniref:Poly [ADP-ribose] polymerase n=1 Tax=Lentinus brumalis TaxID=2498619 RepID=A0A371D7Y8_9APHY|nr:PARP-domain-containing protein [Polyporus brumalis]
MKKEPELVDALGDMQVASKLISSSIPKDANGNLVNPLDAHFRSLELATTEPIAHEIKEFGALQGYAGDTRVLQAFRVEREAAEGDRLLLWHGARTTRFAGILKQGLRIAPAEAPVTGYMFGKGVYFADMLSKSENYCHANRSDNTGLLLLCEVLVKPFYEQYQTNYNADHDCKKAGKKSTKGLGCTQPAEWQDCGDALERPDLRGCHMPNLDLGVGPAVQRVLLTVIRMRYLLMVKMQ